MSTQTQALYKEVEPLLEVWESGEIGSQFGYYARGHHDPAEFVRSCDHYGEENTSEEHLRYYLPMAPEHVRHVYWRTVPILYGDRSYGFRFLPGNGRGAAPYTVLEFVRRTTALAPKREEE
jgi:hypothetical protein